MGTLPLRALPLAVLIIRELAHIALLSDAAGGFNTVSARDAL